MADDNPAEKAASAAKDKMSDLEGKLDKHSDKMPQLSKSNRDMVSNFLPWGGGIFGVLMAVWTMDLWDVIKALGSVSELGSVFGVDTGVSTTKYWIVFVFFAITVAALAWSFYKGVMKKTRAGWTFFFYAFVAAVIGGLLWMFLLDVPSGRGLWALIGGLAGLYLLFQVKDDFKS